MEDEKKDKILVVLCPGDAIAGYKFEDQPQNSKEYLGGDIRMLAAAKIGIQYKLIIVVGGSKEKVCGMKIFLIDNGVNCDKIIRLESNPDTNGNLKAIRKIFDHYKSLENEEVTILSNDYHGNRIKRMAADILTGIKWEFISAENFLEDRSEIIHDIYSEQLKNRIKKEEQGIKDWDKGGYNDQHMEAWQCKSIIRDKNVFN
jgi:hypothetical protein